ncbi:MAG: carboxypeptidase regulatory-like domain-containing protein, partial [Bryobacteraceae bacterium]|nr:carboxypeptidase regulatory-like domain-containing protein [Bryobacteraceae bacterium]
MYRLLKKCLGITVIALCLLVAAPRDAFGQVTSGSIFGTVTDQTGAGVANAQVIITNVNTNTRSEATSNADGNYTRGQLIAGTYRVEIESTGFRRAVTNDVLVAIDTAARVDAKLEIGNVTESIEVTAESPLLKSDRAEISTSFSAKELTDLPSFNRNFQAYQLLAPGNSRLGFQHASSENPQGSVQIQVNGQHFSGTDFQLDGTSNQDPILGIIVINPTIDSVNETKLATQNYDAEFGLAAAGVQIITTKSGSNEFHGSLFEFLRSNTPGF